MGYSQIHTQIPGKLSRIKYDKGLIIIHCISCQVQSGASTYTISCLCIFHPYVIKNILSDGSNKLVRGVKTIWLVVSHKQQLSAFQELSVLGPGACRSEAFSFQGSLRHRPKEKKFTFQHLGEERQERPRSQCFMYDR